jgi:predicted TIM-barrel fold metal-dependent hydrolase
LRCKKYRSLGESLVTGARLLMLVVLFLLTPRAIRAKIPAEGEWPEIPVIDMHTHIFNARDLPLAGILSALGAPRGVAIAVAAIALRSTPEHDGEPLREFSLDQIERPRIDEPTDLERNVLVDYVGEERIEPLTKVATDLKVQPDVTLLAETMAKIGFPPEEHERAQFAPEKLTEAELRASLEGYMRFLGIITKGHHEIVATLKESYKNVDLFVHHMMDMAVAYNDTPRVSFAEQNVVMQDLEKAYPGELLHFTAFDPFRRDKALDLVKKAKEEHNAIGIKIYPPSGYRAADNATYKFPRNSAWWMPHSWANKRWKSRYAGWTEKELDDVLHGAFNWTVAGAVAEEIPIFTHCTPWGFESVKGYGMMADPFFWAKALAKGENKRMRLAFGHAGGDPYWLSKPNKKKYPPPPGNHWQFGNQVVELCLEYPNVYCELGYLEGILHPEKRPKIVKRLQSVINRPTKDGKRFGDKIMYGTDWHMIHKEDGYKDYLKGWDEVMKELEDEKGRKGAWREAFFAGNAKNFLQLEKIAKEGPFKGEQQRKLLELSDAIK